MDGGGVASGRREAGQTGMMRERRETATGRHVVQGLQMTEGSLLGSKYDLHTVYSCITLTCRASTRASCSPRLCTPFPAAAAAAAAAAKGPRWPAAAMPFRVLVGLPLAAATAAAEERMSSEEVGRSEEPPRVEDAEREAFLSSSRLSILTYFQNDAYG